MTIEEHADALASALEDALEELDPDNTEHPQHLGVLRRYRLYRLERHGQQSLALPIHPLDACE